MVVDLNNVFRHPDIKQDKFLSRLFGIFSEEIVKIWASQTLSNYQNLGRPTVWKDSKRHYTLDFTLSDKKTGKNYVCEQKCWFEYENYKHFILDNTDQIEYLRDGSKSFETFLELGQDNTKYEVYVDGKSNPTAVSGIILIWGKVSDKGQALVKKQYKVHDVLSMEAILNDLVKWKTPAFHEWTAQKRYWCNQLFDDISTCNDTER